MGRHHVGTIIIEQGDGDGADAVRRLVCLGVCAELAPELKTNFPQVVQVGVFGPHGSKVLHHVMEE